MQSTPAYLPAAAANDTVEALYAGHGPPRAWMHGLLVAGLAGTLATLFLVRVDLTVRAPGLVRPATGRSEIRMPIGGEIAHALAHDNQSVGAGQPLVVLNTADLDERLALNHQQRQILAATIADLDALVASVADPAGHEAHASVAPSGQPLLTTALRGEQAELDARLEANRLAAAKGRTELARATALADHGIASRRELDDTRYALERTQAEGRLIRQQALTRWDARRDEARQALATLRSEATRLEREGSLATVRAPVAGTIQMPRGFRAGNFVAPGDFLGAISPDDELVAEVLVSPRDIGRVHLGQPVRLQVDAFPPTDWGLLDGIVVGVAADMILAEPAAGPALPGSFKVVIRPAATELRRSDGARGRLQKGHTVVARLQVDRRSLLQILYDDTTAWLDPRLNPARR